MTGCGGVRVKNKTGERTVLCAWNVFESVKLFNTKKIAVVKVAQRRTRGRHGC